nr:DUF3558 domain-containing protein [Amycolatopsis tolypomycina]
MALAGCSGKPTSTGTPSPVTTPSGSSASHTLPYAGAPDVSNPLPASVVAGDPCTDALTPAQVKEALGVEVTGQPGTAPGLGRKCDWANPDTTAVVTVFFITETHQGLSDLYANTKPQAKVWNVLPDIQGYPAVAYLSADGGDPKRTCGVSVGLANDVAIDVELALSRAKIGTVDPCSVAPKAADAVVTTLRQKAGA